MVAIRKDNRKPLSTYFSVDGLKNGEIPCRAPEELIVSVPSQRTMLKRASRSSNVTFMKHCLQGAFRPSNGSAAEPRSGELRIYQTAPGAPSSAPAAGLRAS